jgi:hypothetical protein
MHKRFLPPAGIEKTPADAAIGEPAGDIFMIDSNVYQGTCGRMRGARRQVRISRTKEG